MKDTFVVAFTRSALKDLKKIPTNIRLKLTSWVEMVTYQGLSVAKKIPGYHDELLKGKRMGQRSIRLNKAYRAIYVVKSNGKVEFVEVQEVSKHEY